MNDDTLMVLNAAAGFLQLRLPDEAERELDSLPVEIQGLPEARAMHVNCLIERKRYKEAEAIAAELFRAAPASSWFRQLLAVTVENQGRLEDSLAVLQSAPPDTQKCALELFHEGRLLYSVGRHTEATECMARAAALDPHMMKPGGPLAELR